MSFWSLTLEKKNLLTRGETPTYADLLMQAQIHFRKSTMRILNPFLVFFLQNASQAREIYRVFFKKIRSILVSRKKDRGKAMHTRKEKKGGVLFSMFQLVSPLNRSTFCINNHIQSFWQFFYWFWNRTLTNIVPTLKFWYKIIDLKSVSLRTFASSSLRL